MRLLLDLNSMLNGAQLRGTDHEFGFNAEHDDKKTWVNSAAYGHDNFCRDFADTLEHFGVAPLSVIGVWDGKGAKSRRQAQLSQYKEGRNKIAEVSEELNKSRVMVTATLRALGAQVVTNAGVEADDVIAFLCQQLRSERNTVVTSDGDLCVLVDDNTDVYRGRELNRNPYGPFPHKHITLYKSLVGDTSDRIPGAKGFGDAAWCELVRVFGLEGLDEFVRMIETGKLRELQQSLADMPKLQVVLKEEEMVITSWRVARLQPEEVDLMGRPLEWEAGMAQQWGDVAPELRIERLKQYYGTKTLVSAENYAQALSRVQSVVGQSKFVALDIETAAGMDSDLWQVQVKERNPDNAKLDVLGHELVGMSLTFGSNHQHTIYMAVNHVEEPGVSNITVDQCREMVEAIPKGMQIVIQNRAFEFPILYKTWGDKWLDNGFHGFVPNAVDTAIGASYVNENLPKGLKFRSKLHLGYEQTSFDQVTTIDGVKHKMDQLTAQHVKDYGCDDTICTAALHNHYLTVMELEGSLQAFYDVETLPQYLTSLAFVQGVNISKGRLRQIEDADTVSHEKAWVTFRNFLVAKGWTGTALPVATEVTLQAIKDALVMIGLDEFSTRKRKPEAVAEDIRAYAPDNADANLLAEVLVASDVGTLNAIVKRHFDGEPKINLDSPLQVRKLLYGVIGITPRIYNKLTEKERANDEFRESFYKIRQYQKNPDKVEVTDADRAVWIKKSSTDDDVVELALLRDTLPEDARAALQAFADLKSIETRRKLFYKPYKAAPHWSDSRVHSNMNQCEADTRRYSSSDPNLQQLPKDGPFREVVLPHGADCVVVSLDFNAQELVLCAEQSQDANLLSCYVGDNKRDGHSLIAVAAAPLIWGSSVTYEDFMAMRKSKDDAVKLKAGKLRDDAKTVNFATQFGAMAPKVAVTLRSSEEDAQKFIDAKDEAFPGINVWKQEVSRRIKQVGYTTTLLGARRHLAATATSHNNWENMRGERQGINFEIQGSAAEQSKLAMASMWRQGLFTGRYDAQFIAPIHDETVSSVHRSQVLPFVREAHACMVQQYANMEVPMKSSLSLGRNFACPIELGTDFTDEQVVAAVDKLFGVQV